MKWLVCDWWQLQVCPAEIVETAIEMMQEEADEYERRSGS